MNIVKILYGIAFATAFVLTGCASTPETSAALDNEFIIDGNKILVTDMESKLFSDEKIIHSKDYPNGIFIMIDEDVNGTAYPHAIKLVREIFTEKGFKIADQLDGSDLAINLSFYKTYSGSFSVANAEKQAAHDSSMSGEAMIANAGVLAGAVLTSGPIAAAGGLMALLIDYDEKTLLGAMIYTKPVIDKSKSGLKAIKSSTGKVVTNIADVDYRVAKKKDGQAPDTAVLKMLVAQWVKRYMVLDVDPVTVGTAQSTTPGVQAVSVVPPSLTVSDGAATPEAR